MTSTACDCLRHENVERAVSEGDTKTAVWKKSGLGNVGTPLVTDEEWTTLVNRPLKHQEPDGDLIRMVPGYSDMQGLAR